jgi:tyrosinase
MDREAAQSWVDDLLTERPAQAPSPELHAMEAEAPRAGFSPFFIDDVMRATDVAADLMRAANAADDPDAAWSAVREQAEAASETEDPALVRHALKVFMTHHPVGRRQRIAPLEVRAPHRVIPSTLEEPRLSLAAMVAPDDPEAVLAWWREDPEANEHHDHWHVVYPTGGVFKDGDPDRRELQDRQGELFIYMHQQMLARYDHERIAVGLGPVEPLERYADPLAERYTAGNVEQFPQEWIDNLTALERRSGSKLPDPLVIVRPDQTTIRRPISFISDQFAALQDTIATGQLKKGGGGTLTATIDLLGQALEPARLREPTQPAPDPATYPNFHGIGHGFISRAGGDGQAQGVMADTDTAIRDAAFYRWHRHIDDVAYDWQERQAPHTEHAQWAAPVTLRKGDAGDDRPGQSPDLFLLFEDQVEGDDLAGWAEQALGGDHWDDRPAIGTDELETEMLTRRLVFAEHPELDDIEVAYLDQRAFAYAVRVENDSDEAREVTLRLFFVADQCFDERRQWIELDKWKHPLGPRERSVAVRRGASSSVIRKPALKPPGSLQHSPDRPAGEFDENSYCECGWPYNLLLPRGTAEGMPFWLVAIATDSAQDSVEESTCGSMSFCGAKDRYPDTKPMGYPFDRRVSGGPLAICGWPNAAARSFRIRWTNAAA